MACANGIARAKYGHRLHQLLRLRIEAACGGGHFFYQGRILLGGLVHLHHGFTHLMETLACVVNVGKRWV